MEEKFMKEAIKCAKAALKDDEVPIGAVVVLDGKVISRGRNRRAKKQIATAHAEVEAIEKACKKLGSWRLPECEMYVTLEPCPMCLGAMLNARIKKVYFGAHEDKGRSLTEVITSANVLNHRMEYEGGVLEAECKAILSGYFEAMRCRTHWNSKGLDTEPKAADPEDKK
ncbi:MAG: nucleoside deaminase [Clostridia bacterium]|nr:nucleoside deaminase [Clostridia bacterium]